MANKTNDYDVYLPLCQGILKHQKREQLSLHTPGHKGRVKEFDWYGQLIEQILSFDVTEVPGLDDLAAPTGIIKAAQDLMAHTFKAEASYFLINGSSVGIQAMILATCPPGSKILVPRNIHKSVFSGMILADVTPVFIETYIDQDFSVALPFQINKVKEQLEAHSDIAAVLVVNPTYHGLSGDLQALVELVHQYQLPLLVDEAHGTHFNFHPNLPPTGMEVGADLVVQSLHKTGLSLTQTAVLHWQSSRVPREKIEAVLPLLQSSSPSYLLMSSLDWARAQMDRQARSLLTEVMQLLKDFESQLGNIDGIEVINRYWQQQTPIYATDPLKVSISARNLGLSGHDLALYLRKDGIEVELVEPNFVLGIFSLNSTKADVDHLLQSLTKLGSKVSRRALGCSKAEQSSNSMPILPNPQQVLAPRQAWFSQKQQVPLGAALGKVVAQVIAPCPPGIPLVCPGELVDEQVIDNLKYWQVESLEVVR